MISDLDYAQLQILTLNVFIVLLKASTLNPYNLKSNLEEVKLHLYNSRDSLHCDQIMILLISVLLIFKFLAGYITLAANIIAMFPILTKAMPQLLVPPMLAQVIDTVLLNLFEIILGYFTLYYYAPTPNSKVSILVVFLTSMTIKISMAISTLNIYSDFYQHLNAPACYSYDSDDSMTHQEQFIKSQILV